MIEEISKASMWKRASAALFDIVMLATLAVGLALVLSWALDYNAQLDVLTGHYDRFAAEYGIDLDISAEDFAALTETEKNLYATADEAFSKDADVIYTYNLLLSLAMVIVTFAILLAYILLEFAIPLLFKNGQTMGKKLFGICVVRVDCVRLSALQLFARTVLGKYTIGTMIPVYLLIMIVFGQMGFMGTVLVGGLFLVQAIMLFATPYHTPIHDKLAGTMTVDYASQMIFDSPEALLAYKQRIHAEQVERSER